jgi:hypothetical protein
LPQGGRGLFHAQNRAASAAVANAFCLQVFGFQLLTIKENNFIFFLTTGQGCAWLRKSTTNEPSSPQKPSPTPPLGHAPKQGY